jgi:S-adenosylmethionine hydrolase
MSRIISITSDLGDTDYFVALLKGAIYSVLPEGITLCDISNDIDPHDIQQAAFFLGASYTRFPKETIHIAKVYSYYSRKPELICFKQDGHYFVGPNNGIFSLIFPELEATDCYSIIFDSSDINAKIAHACACIDKGLYPEEVGNPLSRLNKKLTLKAVTTSSNIRATIIHVDHFQNVILNVSKSNFDLVRKGRRFELFYQQRDPITKISEHYSQVPVGDVLCTFNSVGLLEIAINMGAGSSSLNLKKGETIQIYFYD